MTGCLDDVPIFSLYKTNDRNTPTNSFPGISSCFIGFDFDSETSLIVKRVHQVTPGKAGTVHLVAALFSSLLRGRSAVAYTVIEDATARQLLPQRRTDTSINFLSLIVS